MPLPWGRTRRLECCSTKQFQAVERSMTLHQLRQLRDYVKRLCKAGLLKYADDDPYHKDDKRVYWFNVNQYDINELVIKKVIPEEKSCSWVELVAKQPQKPDTFVSHFWGESFRDFMLSMEHHATEWSVQPDHTYWFCVCAGNQWKIDKELDKTIEELPFFNAIQEAQDTLLMLDRKGIVMSRAWCLWEWHRTILLRPESLRVATAMGLVGSALVSSGPYVDLLKSLSSTTADASDPRDLWRIRKSIAGQSADRDRDSVIVTVERAVDGVITTEGKHGLQSGDVALYRKGLGSALHVSGKTLEDRKEFVAKVVTPTEVLLYHCDDDKLEGQVKTRGGESSSLVNKKKYKEWLQKHKSEFDELEKRVKDQTLPDVRNVAFPKHVRVSVSSVPAAYRCVTLAQLRRLAQDIKRQCETWDLTTPGLNPTQLVIESDEGVVCKTKWEQLNLAHVIDHVITRACAERKCSFVETMDNIKPLRAHFYVSYTRDMGFSEFIEGIEWLVEARQMADTTPIFTDLLSVNRYSEEYDDEDLWRKCMDACEHVVLNCVKGSAHLRAGPLLDLHEAISRNKSVDLTCGTGALALVRPFTAGSWELGNFNVSIATGLVTMDVASVRSFNEKFFDRFRSKGSRANSELMKMLRLAGAGPMLRDAAYRNDKEKIEFVFEQCPWLNLQSPRLQGPLGETPLHLAAAAGSTDALPMLLVRGSDVNAVDFDGETPLHLAALAGKVQSAKILLWANADPNRKSYFSETPLDIARERPAEFLGDLVDYEGVEKLLLTDQKCGTGEPNNDEQASRKRIHQQLSV